LPQLSCSLEGGGSGEERREIKEREAERELRRQMRTLPHVSLGQGCWMRQTGENTDRGVGFHPTGKAKRASDKFYPLTIGMEEATRG